MSIIIETLTDTTPRYFTSQDAAFYHHYTHGGLLWKRRDGMSESYKPFAHGVLPVSRLAIYDLFMVDGRKPTDDDIQEASILCYAKRDEGFSSNPDNEE